MSGPSDSYESEYMGSEGAILAREKIVARTGIRVALGLAVALALAAPVLFLTVPGMGALALLPLIPSAILGLTSTAFGVLRTIVTGEHVHVQLGYHGPRIPISAIEGVAVAASPRPNAWGVRVMGRGYWSYTTSLPRGLAIAWRDEKGAQRKIFVSSLDPETLRDAIETARAASSARPEAAPSVRVRIEPGAPDDEAAEEISERADAKQDRRAD